MTEVMLPLERLKPVRASQLKTAIADTYAAADREPIAIVKGKGAAHFVCTHVLMSAAHYRALTAALSLIEPAVGEPAAARIIELFKGRQALSPGEE